MIRLITIRVLKPLQECLSPSVLVFMSVLEINCNQKIHQNHGIKKLLLWCLLLALISGKLWCKMPDSKKDDLGYYTEEPCPEKLLVHDKENMTVL